MSTFGVGPINLAGLVSTGDKVALTFKLEALDPSKYTVPTTIAAPAGLVGSGKGPSFKEVVAPILEQNCASCHQPDTVGYAHYKLTTAGDAAKVADGLRRRHRGQVHATVAGVGSRRAAAALEGAQPEGHRHDRGVGGRRRQARRAGVDTDHAGQVPKPGTHAPRRRRDEDAAGLRRAR